MPIGGVIVNKVHLDTFSEEERQPWPIFVASVRRDSILGFG